MAHPCMLYGWYGSHDQSDQQIRVLFEVTWPEGYTGAEDYEPGPYPQVPEWYSTTHGELAFNEFLKADPAEMVWMDVVTDGTVGQVKIGAYEGAYGDCRPGVPYHEAGTLPALLQAVIPICDTFTSPQSWNVQDYAYLAYLWSKDRFTAGFDVGRGHGIATLSCLGAIDPTTGYLLELPYPPSGGEVVAKSLGTVEETTDTAGQAIVDGATADGTSLL